MASVNKVILIGRLGKDPDVRYTQSGTAVANFSLATSEEWKDKNTGQKQSKTEWHRVVAWRKLAELCSEYLHKGSEVYVEGSLQTKEWETNDGQKRRTTEVLAYNIQFIGDRGQAKEQETVAEDDPPF